MAPSPLQSRHRLLAIGNRLALPFIALAGPIAGSGVSIMTIAGMVLGLFRLALRGVGEIPPALLPSALAFAGFFTAEAVSAVINRAGMPGLIEIGENAAFLGLVPFYAMIMGNRKKLLREVLFWAPYAALPALALATYQYWVLGMRPLGTAGNQAIFTMCGALIYVLVLVAARRGVGRPILWIVGGMAAAGVVVMGGSRAIWPVLVLAPAICLLAPGNGFGIRITWKTGGALAAAVLIGAIAFGPSVVDRVRMGAHEISRTLNGQTVNSVGLRLAMWRVAFDAIPQKPVFGHGPQSPRVLIPERMEHSGTRVFHFTHFHNVVLNEMVRAGAVGTAALFLMILVPAWSIWRARHDDTSRTAFAIYLGLLAVWLLGGSLNIMFDHDILDTLFVAMTAMCLYLCHGKRLKQRKPQTLSAAEMQT